MAANPGFNEAAWAGAIASKIGAPANGQNTLQTLEAWFGGEGTYGEFNNPLDTTLKEPGSVNEVQTSTPGVYVQGYPTPAEGIAATAATLQGYPGVLADLKAGAPPATTEAAITSSPWGTVSFTSPGTVTPAPASEISALLGGSYSGGSGGVNSSPESANAATSPAGPDAPAGGISSGTGTTTTPSSSSSSSPSLFSSSGIVQIGLTIVLVGAGLGVLVLGLSRLFPGKIPEINLPAALAAA